MIIQERRNTIRQKGYSLVELSVALSIVAVVLVGGLMGARQVLLSNSTNNQIRESNKVINNIKKALQNQKDTSALSSYEAAVRLGVWPNDRGGCGSPSGVTLGTCTVPKAVFNGASEIIFNNKEKISDNMLASTGLMYVLNKVPAAACADLVNGLDGVAYAMYAGKSNALPVDGATPVSDKYFTVKNPDTTSVDIGMVGKACSGTGFADIYVAVQI